MGPEWLYRSQKDWGGKGTRGSGRRRRKGEVRRRVYLIQEATSIGSIKHTREPPRSILEGLDVHDLDEKQVAGHGALDLEGPAEVVNLCQVDVAHVVSRVIVSDLASSPLQRSDLAVLAFRSRRQNLPVETFNLYGLAVFDGASEGNWQHG
jgi:hypothetical protein